MFHFNITFPHTCYAKKLHCFGFWYVHNNSNLKFGPIGACYQECKNLWVRVMMAEIKPRLATNIIFTTVVVSLLAWKYWFSRLQLRHFLFSTTSRYWRISVFYRALKTGLQSHVSAFIKAGAKCGNKTTDVICHHSQPWKTNLMTSVTIYTYVKVEFLGDDFKERFLVLSYTQVILKMTQFLVLEYALTYT